MFSPSFALAFSFEAFNSLPEYELYNLPSPTDFELSKATVLIHHPARLQRRVDSFWPSG